MQATSSHSWRMHLRHSEMDRICMSEAPASNSFRVSLRVPTLACATQRLNDSRVQRQKFPMLYTKLGIGGDLHPHRWAAAAAAANLQPHPQLPTNGRPQRLHYLPCTHPSCAFHPTLSPHYPPPPLLPLCTCNKPADARHHGQRKLAHNQH